jgi:hypothetical protein
MFALKSFKVPSPPFSTSTSFAGGSPPPTVALKLSLVLESSIEGLGSVTTKVTVTV